MQEARVYLDDLATMTGLPRYNGVSALCTDLGIEQFPDREAQDMYILRVDAFQLLRCHLGYMNNIVFQQVRNIERVYEEGVRVS